MTDSDVRRIEDKVDGVGLLLAEMKGSLQPTLDKLSDRQQEESNRVDDHEARLRRLERFRYSWPSVAILGLFVSAATLVYYITHLH